MTKPIIRQGSAPPDPIGELRDAVASLREEISALQDTIKEDHDYIKSVLQEILREIESKSDRD